VAEDLIAKYTAMVAKSPNNELARFSLAKALFDAGRFAEAGDAFQWCVQKKGDWMVPTIMIGRCQLQLGNTAAARVSLEKARQLAIEQHHDGPLEEIDGLLSSIQSS
jgi:Flp pilus assembly protein TadD